MKILATNQSTSMTSHFKAAMNEVTFAVCDECELRDIEVGGDWTAAHEAALALSAAYPRDEGGNLEALSAREMDALREERIVVLQEIGGMGIKAADFLTRTPELARANYNCDLRRQLGECAMIPKDIKL